MGETTDELIAMLDTAIETWLEDVEEDFLDTHGEPPPPIPSQNPRRWVKREGPILKLTRSDARIVPQESTQALTEEDKGTETEAAYTQLPADSDENKSAEA
ncbi:hypothetical protein PGQ11_000338 [Apiospora arundinis]